jgi:alpha-L-fucosidase
MMQSWFPNAKLGIFIHWGIYAVEGTSESWAIFSKERSYDAYMNQRHGLTAAKYDPRAWAELFKRAGDMPSDEQTMMGWHCGIPRW